MCSSGRRLAGIGPSPDKPFKPNPLRHLAQMCRGSCHNSPISRLRVGLTQALARTGEIKEGENYERAVSSAIGHAPWLPQRRPRNPCIVYCLALCRACHTSRLARARYVGSFIGGVLIHPASVLICKLLGSTGAHSKDNPLGSLAWASTIWLIFSLPLAYGVALYRIEWFFPAMLLIIGGRYLVFASLFGMRLYWALGLSLAVAAHLLSRTAASPVVSAFVGAGIEALFAVGVLVGHGRWARANNSFKQKPLRGSA